MEQIFDDSILANGNNAQQLGVLGSLAYCLAQALAEKNEATAWGWLTAASQVGHQLDCKAFNDLYEAVVGELVRKFPRSSSPGTRTTSRPSTRENWRVIRND